MSHNKLNRREFLGLLAAAGLSPLAARLAGAPIVVNTLHGFYFHEGMRPAWRRFYILVEKIAARCSGRSPHVRTG